MASLYLVDTLDDVTVGGQVSLDGAEGRHAVTVSRVRVGEQLRLSATVAARSSPARSRRSARTRSC